MNTPSEKVTLLVYNRAGVLDRVVGQIRREGWNIKSLAVDETEDRALSQMDIVFEGGHVRSRQILARLKSLDCVAKVQAVVDGRTVVAENLPPPPAPPESPVQKRPTAPPPKAAGTLRILIINPGSTSTKMALYDEDRPVVERTVSHSREELDACGGILQQRELRAGKILQMLAEDGITTGSIDAVAGRGGLLKPIESGTYEINDPMLHDLRSAAAAIHASALGGIIARDLADKIGVRAYIVDPIVVDETDQFARLTGMPGIERRSVFHALNQKAIARRCADYLGRPYENCRFIVAHLGGGVTVGAHRYGRVIDVNDALSGEGPFTPERTGSIPAVPLIQMCFSGEYTQAELIGRVTQNGGMQAYLGTNDLSAVERMIREEDEFAALVLDSMAYQVAKEIGSMVAALSGRVDAILLTGGMAHSSRFTGAIKERVDAIAPVHVYPGENEMLALAGGVLRVLRGEERAMQYQ